MPLDIATLPAHIATEFHKPTQLLERSDVILPQFYQWHATENPNYPLFVYQDGDHLEYITYSQANRAMERIARFVASVVGTGHVVPPVVALYANAGEYFCFTYLSVFRQRTDDT